MKESFLHYIWEHQYFSKTNLFSTSGEEVAILKPGTYNLDSGPDFHFGTVKVGELEFVGHIEIHIRSSEWYNHKHQEDVAYDLVVLHVVWEDNRPISRTDGSIIPTIELKERVNPKLLLRSEELFCNLDTLVCENSLPIIEKRHIFKMINRGMEIRLIKKSESILKLFYLLENDWNETIYQLMASNFGFRVNSFAFKRLSELLPFKIVRKHSMQIFQIEALLLGTAGFLELRSPKDKYYLDLKNEFRFLRKKYGLDQIVDQVAWKYSRMRPANFPQLRIAQFAALLHQSPQFFNQFLSGELKEIIDILKIKQSEYWQNHYKFGKLVRNRISGMGSSSVFNLMINTVIPFIYSYGTYYHDNYLKEKSIKFLKDLEVEKNQVTRMWIRNGILPSNAGESQGLYSLYENFCKPNRCLQCEIGLSLFNR